MLASLAALPFMPFLPRAFAADTPIHALPRAALVIGNCAYADAPLRNPINDAEAIGAQLKQFGFSVDLLVDARRDAMHSAVSAYCARLEKQKAVGVFYFAGHGLQLDWRNFLVPVDARLSSSHDVQDATLDLGTLFAGLGKAKNPMNIVMLDACRDNPFDSEHKTGKGLSQMDAPTGTLLAYATAPGNVAADGTGKHGLYTENLLREMLTPEVKIEDVLKRVRLAVRRGSQGQQIPWESTSLEDDFYFKPPADLRKRSEEELTRLFAVELSVWQAADESQDSDALAVYLQRYPSGHFSELAQVKFDRILAKKGEMKAKVASSPQNPYSKGTRALSGFRVGDFYEYRIVDLLTKLEKPSYIQRVTAVSDDVVIYNNGTFVTDLLGNTRISNRGDRFGTSQFYVSEYSLGKKWTTRYPAQFADGKEDVIERDFRVVALETIEVPAGKFECFRVESSGWSLQRGVRLETVYWMAPERVNRVIAIEERNRGAQRRMMNTDRRELVSYVPNNA